MKKLYSFFLAAIAMLGISFSAQADQVTLEWDLPGSIDIRVGSTSNPLVDLGEATSYVCEYDGFTSIYIYAKEGYILTKGVNLTSGAEYKYNTWVKGLSISANSSTNNQKIKIECGKLIFDSSITVDIEGLVGKDDITATVGTRVINLTSGLNTIEYSSEYEKTLVFDIVLSNAKGLTITENGEDVTWSKFYGSFRMNEIPLNNGSEFVIHYNDKVPVTVEKYTVTLAYANDLAKDAINMIFNRTTFESIDARDSFEVEAGNKISITFNTTDYNVTVNDTPVTPGSDESTTWFTDPINANTTITISAEERSYGTTYINVGIINPEGVELHNGAIDGPVFDLSEYTPTEKTEYNATFQVYRLPVSLKSPKIFVNAKEGWYIPVAGYGNPDSQIFNETYSTNASESGTYHVWTHKIDYNTKLVVFYKSQGTTSANLKDKQRKSFQLKDGYNEFMIDPEYNCPLSVAPLKDLETTDFSVYVDYTAAAIDDNGVYSGINITKPSVIQIFAGRPAPKKITYNVTNEAPTAPKIVYDYVLSPAEDATSFSTFVGSNVNITVAPGYVLLLDGNVLPLDENNSISFAQEQSQPASHEIQIISPAKIETTPAEGDKVEDLESIIITFPYATSVAFDQEIANDEVTLTRGQEWGFLGWESITKIRNNKYRFTPKGGIPAGDLTLTIHADYFKINGDFTNALTYVNFNNAKTIPDWEASPEGTVVNKYGIFVAFSYGEEASAKVVDFSGVTVTYQGKTLTQGAEEDYTYEVQYGFIMFNLNEKYAGTEGELTISVPAGAATVNGKPTPAMEYTWNVILPKDYQLVVTPEFELDAVKPDQELKFLVEIPVAAKATIFNQNMFRLANKSYTYSVNGKAVEVEAAEYPTFELTFPAVGKEMEATQFTLSINYGAFYIDDVQDSPSFTENYTITVTDKNVMEYTLTPKDGSTVESIETITIAFPNATEVTFAGEGDGMTSEIIMRNDSWTFFTQYFTVEKVADATVPTFTLTPDNAAKANGEYTFTISAAQFMINGKENEEIVANYTVYKEITAEDLVYTLDPAANSEIENEYAQSITVAFADGLNIDGETLDETKISITLNGTDLEAGTDFTVETYLNFFSINVAKTALEKKAGTLALNLAAGWAKIAGLDAPAVSAEWTVVGDTDGISAIFGDGVDSFTVVTVDGRVILVNADAAALKQLAAGLYIINGQKIYLTK